MQRATKTQRVRAVTRLLSQTECSVTELIQRLGMDVTQRRSIQRDLSELVRDGELRCHQGRYGVPPTAGTLNPVEALAVYSATRMLFHGTPEYNEHYLAALEKLTSSLPEPARRIAQQANTAYRKRDNGTASRTFEMVAQSWLHGRVLGCSYQSKRQVSRLALEIYLIEVNPRNREAYAIGRNRLADEPRPLVYRLSRMRQTMLSTESYEIPDDFTPERFLANAWGIMPGKPTPVELLFTPRVQARIAEEHFGSLLFSQVVLHSGHTRVVLHVGNWLELAPWILGWGGDVEVIGPPPLRDHVATALQEGAACYIAR